MNPKEELAAIAAALPDDTRCAVLIVADRDGKLSRAHPGAHAGQAIAMLGMITIDIGRSLKVIPVGAEWVHLADEGQTVEVPADTTVRYGADGIWVERVVGGTITCDNALFGDPVPGTRKVCQRLAIAGEALPIDEPAEAAAA